MPMYRLRWIQDVLDDIFNRKDKMGVIVHDFDDMRETVHSSRMYSFRYKHPKAFETTSLQITCGHLEKKEQVLKQMQKLSTRSYSDQLATSELTRPFTDNRTVTYAETDTPGVLQSGGRSQDSTSVGSSVDPSEDDGNNHDTIRNAKAPGDKTKRSANERQPSSRQASRRACLTREGTSGGSHQTLQASMDERNPNPPRDISPIGQQRSVTYNAKRSQVSLGQQSMAHSSGGTVTSAPQRSHTTPTPRRISISVCSSAYEHNVKGFMSKLTELQMITDVRFRSLPYNDINSFRFLSNDPVDVMVLCHSVQNRGFSITNVLNALYEKHLQYCHDVIGKKKLAVIVHDFSDCQPKILDARMESFRRSQSLTFELVDTVIVCGSLEKPGNIEMRDDDMTRLTTFFEQARYEQKENYAVKQSIKKSFLGIFK
eukprot:XP_011678988.1 PREDICTED: uncharacterized protein LOC100888403 [Strongylocentrotus purpuratus]